jgi:hypothetical protein
MWGNGRWAGPGGWKMGPAQSNSGTYDLILKKNQLIGFDSIKRGPSRIKTNSSKIWL